MDLRSKTEGPETFKSIIRKVENSGFTGECRLNPLRWYGQVERSDGWIKSVTEIDVEGRCPPGGGKKRWSKLISEDMKLMGLTKAEVQNRSEWRAKIHSRIHQKTSTQ